jgi:HEAT repeat protein
LEVHDSKQNPSCRLGLWFAMAALILSSSISAMAQVAPLAPRWLAGTPPPPVETFADGLARHHIDITEPALIAALHDPDGDVRSLAAAQLAAMDDHPALKFLIQAFQDERDPQVQVNIAGAATWLGSNLATQQLQTICQDVNMPSTARLDASRYVSNKQLSTCFPAVREIFKTDEDPSVRVLAIAAAVNYYGQADSAQSIAVQALGDIDPNVRTAAADALVTLHATGQIKPLESTLQSEGDETAREHLRNAIRILKLANATDKTTTS